MEPQPPGANDDVDYPGYEDPHGEMPVDDEEMPPPQSQWPEPDLDHDPIELGSGGNPRGVPPKTGTQVPATDGEDWYLDMPHDPSGDGGGPPPRGGPQGRDLAMAPRRMKRPSMEYLDEPPPPQGPPSAPGLFRSMLIWIKC